VALQYLTLSNLFELQKFYQKILGKAFFKGLTMTSNVSKGDPNFKKYIMEYGHYMNKSTRVRILNLIMYHIEDNTETEIDHMQLKSDIIIKSGNGLNIDLDKLDDELLTQIYNIINRRMEILNTPYISFP